MKPGMFLLKTTGVLMFVLMFRVLYIISPWLALVTMILSAALWFTEKA